MAYKKILFRRDPAASWTSENPVLSAGEVGLETDTGKIKIGNGSSAWTALSYFVGNLPGATLDAIGDVTITSVQNGDFLRYNGSASVWVNDPVNLSTDTVGNYVESLVAGTGVSLLNNSGEGATPTVSIGQAVGTSSSVTFANVTADLVGNVTGNITGNAGTATTLQTARTIQISGDVSGSASFDGSGNINITSTVQPNSVALGTDTTGNYMSDLTQGNGVTITHTPGEGSNATIAIGQDVAASSSVTFANVTSNLTGNVTGNADTATALQSARTISLIGDVSGSVSFDGTSNAQITTAIQPNSIVLGTDTTGNYMESITNGTGIFLEHVLGEASQATISIGQAVGTSDNVTFAGVTADAIRIGVTNANTIDTVSDGLTINTTSGTVTIDDNLIVTGALTVSGSVTYVNTQNLQVGDAVITLNHDEAGVPSQNAGIEIERGTSTNVVLHYNETSDIWELTNDGSSYSPIETTSTVTTKLNQQSSLLDVWAVTNEALPNSPTYTAGTSDLNGGTGIGAKLTATTNGLLYVDNIPAGMNYRVLVKNQANALHNGIYKVTATGSASATWELTRSSDFDNSTLGQTIVGKTVRAAADGDVNEFQVFAVTSLGSQYLGDIPEMVHVIGTDPIVWSQVSGKAVLIPGNGLEIVNNTLTLPSIAQTNTASTSGASNFVQNVSVDSYGRLIGITTNDALLALGTNTTGDYVASISASVGTGITVSGAGEGAVVEVSSNATPNNTANTIVMRDSSGYFSATGITAELTGNASTANTLYVSRSIGLTGDLSGSVSFDGSQDVVIAATIEPNSVALGTDTTGNYVSSLVAGTGITLSNNSGETATPTVAIGQAVETSSSVTFANVTADLVGNVTGNVIGSVNGNAGSATVLQTARNIAGQLFNGSADISIAPTDLTGVTATATELNYVDGVTSAIQTQLDGKASSTTSPVITLAGDLSGSATFTNLGNATLTATIGPNSVALGTDTTGNYVNDVTAGTGISVTHTPGEGSSATIAINATLDNLSDVTVPSPSSGDFLKWNGSAWVNDPINLGTDTSGNYMSDLTQGTGVTITHTPGEGSNATIAIGQSVATSDSPTFAALNLNGNIVFEGTTADNFETTLSVTDPTEDRTITLPNVSGTVVTTGDTGTVTSTMIADGTIVNGDINASAAIADTKLATISTADKVSLSAINIDGGTDIGAALADVDLLIVDDGGAGTNRKAAVTRISDYVFGKVSGDVTIASNGAATIAANSVALGTDTTGDYVSSLVAGTGITLTNNTGESATPTVAIGQAVATSSSVTFAQVTTTGNVVVGGNLQVTGTTTTVNQTSLNISDPLIYLNGGSEVTDPDLGIAGNYNDGTYAHAGIFSDASDGHKWKFFKGLTEEPTSPINTAHASYAAADVEGRTFSSTVATGTAPLSVSSSTVVTNLNADKLDGQDGSYYAPLASPTFTGTVTLPTGTVTSGMILDGTIANADINASAAIALSKLASGTSGQIIVANSLGVPTWVSETGDVTISDTGVTAIASGVIVNADVNASAAIDYSKLAALTSGNILVGNASNVATSTAVSGDITITNAGVTAIGSGVIVNADINASAAIAHSKLANATAGQVLLGTTTTGVVTATTVSGDVTITGAGVTAIGSGVVVNADISASAAIDYSKLATLTSGNILVGNASNVATSTAVTGDVTITNAGVTAIATGVIVNADINASAAIDKTKISGTAITAADTGTVTSAMIADGTIVNADISSTAAIDLGKLADVSTNAQTASYTLVLGDKNKVVEMNVASANNLTVPLNSSVAFPVGSQINILQTGAGQTTVVATGGVTINATPGLKMRAQWSYATLIKRATDTWVLVGDISA